MGSWPFQVLVWWDFWLGVAYVRKKLFLITSPPTPDSPTLATHPDRPTAHRYDPPLSKASEPEARIRGWGPGTVFEG